MLGKLGQGDVVIVTRIDRLARSLSICLRSSSALAMQGQSLAVSQNRWPTPVPAPAPAASGWPVLGGLADLERDLIRGRGKGAGKGEGQIMGSPE